MRLFPLAALLACTSTAALAAPLPTCSAGAPSWRADTFDIEGKARAEWQNVNGDTICGVLHAHERQVGSRTFRFTIAVVSRPGLNGQLPEQLSASLSIARLTEGREVVLGRFRIPLEEANEQDALSDVQLVEADGQITASLMMRSSPQLFLIKDDAVEHAPDNRWISEFSPFLGAHDSMGRILHLDLAAMTALVAVHQKGAADPATPGSAFTERRAFRVEFTWRDGQLALGTARSVSAAGLPALSCAADDAEEEADVRKRVGALPPHVEPCWISAWSVDKDPKGLNVRTKPDASSRVLGQLAPPRFDRSVGETLAKEVSIIGYQSGWFLIETKREPEDDPRSGSSKAGRRGFEGRGWVSTRMLGASTAYSGFVENRLYAAPTFDARSTVGRNGDGSPLGGDSLVARIHACSRDWALIETTGGQRGWRRRLCSSQVTNCS